MSLAAFLMAGCGGGGSGSGPVPIVATVTATPAPILIAGATYVYTGTQKIVITYTNPSSTSVNSTAGYGYTETLNVLSQPNASPAAFDLNSSTTYTVTQAPSSGELLQTSSSDQYENQSVSGTNETISLVAGKSSSTGVDLSAALTFGNGPFNETGSTATTYVTAQTIGVYPLQTGAVFTEPLARTINHTGTDVNAAGTFGSAAYTTNQTMANDGSGSASFAIANGSAEQLTISPNGTVQNTLTLASGVVQQTLVGTAQLATVPPTIPVTYSASGQTYNYAATDWYPGGAAAPMPLSSFTRTVKGPVALPAACAFSGTPPPVTEVDSMTSTLDPLESLGTFSAQIFEANGVEICEIATQTTIAIDVYTGLTVSTTVSSITETLTSTNQSIAGIARKPV